MVKIFQDALTLSLLITVFLNAIHKDSATKVASPSRPVFPDKIKGVLENQNYYDLADDEAKCQFGPGWANLYGGCYYITKNGVAWETARKACQSTDPLAEFGTMWSTADMDFVARLARSRDLANVYVNGRYDIRTGDFRWHLGRPVNPTFTPWGAGEPKTSHTGQAIALHAPSSATSLAYLAVSPEKTLIPALCKRAAKGFRRKTHEEISHTGNLLTHRSNGLSLAMVGQLPSEHNPPGPPNRTPANSPPHQVSKIQEQTVYQRPTEPKQPKTSSSPPGRSHESPFASSVLGITEEPTSPKHRILPPPLSKNRKFIPKLGQFESVMPAGKPKGTKSLEVSAIEPIDVVDIVKAREDKLNELFGRSALRLKETMAYFPEDYRYPTTDYQRMAHVLTTELLAQDQRERKTDAPYEVAKVLSMNLFNKGRARQCYFGEQNDVLSDRQVECVATAGVIDACVKQVLLSGKVIRGCGLPGTDRQTKKSGCVQSTNGQICYCNHDNCNSARSVVGQTFPFLFPFFFAFAVTCAYRHFLAGFHR